jgi:hypothetical protein
VARAALVLRLRSSARQGFEQVNDLLVSKRCRTTLKSALQMAQTTGKMAGPGISQ